MFPVAQVDHEHVVLDVDVQMFFGQAEKGSRALHVAHDAVGVGQAFQQQAARAQQQVEFTAQQSLLVRL